MDRKEVVRMNEVRLIDANALKKTFENACIYGLPMNKLYGAILKIIDNAPTVESDYEWGYSEGVHDTERPQGEWIREIHPYDKAYRLKCSVCGKWGGLTDEGYNHEFNFCPNCGADMRKGGAENE